MTVRSVLETVRAPGAQEPRAYYAGAIVRSEVFPPEPFDVVSVEHAIGGKLPSDLLDLYRLTGGMDLFKDVDGGLYGLEISRPREVLATTEGAAASPGTAMIRGDLIFARWCGEGFQFVIRCDPSCEDFGQILFLDPQDPREYWVTVADSLTEILERMVASRGHGYWPPFGDPGPRLA